MKIELLNKIQLNEFIASQPHTQFLQSWDWGEFQRSVGQGVWRLGVHRAELGGNELIASAQIIQHQLPLKKSYLYCPRGPVFANDLTNDQKTEALKLILSKDRDITLATSQTEEIFFRLEPGFEIQPACAKPELRYGRRRAKATLATAREGRNSKFEIPQTKPIQPANTLILDLTQNNEQLLHKMHPKTRYNIKVAERHGITIQEAADFESVWPLFLQTSKRDKFSIHPKNYYQKMLAVIPWIKLWTAEHQNMIVAGAIIGCCGDTATYLHGASDYNQRSLMAPYLLHWQIIQKLKKPSDSTIKYYDFYGIAPINNDKREMINDKHLWAGITRFKLGFGGQVINYPGAFDFIYQPGWYKIYKTLRTINLFLRKI